MLVRIIRQFHQKIKLSWRIERARINPISFMPFVEKALVQLHLCKTRFYLVIMISIIGAGKVGSAAAFSILGFRISDVVLVDIAENLAQGEALDMMQAAPAIEFDGKIRGTSDYSEMEGSELVIVTAGQARQPGMSRFGLAGKNAKIVKSVVKEVVKYCPDCKLMMVSNPVDVMTYLQGVWLSEEPGFRDGKHSGHSALQVVHRAGTGGFKRRYSRSSNRGARRFHGASREVCLCFRYTDNRIAGQAAD